jgi:hypothetical protein
MDNGTAGKPKSHAAERASRKYSGDILALLYTTVVFWGITFIWLSSDTSRWLEPPILTEAETWMLALSGLIFVFLFVAWIVSWWPVILAVINCLLVVNLVLYRQSAKMRWLCASAAAVFVLPVAAHISPGGIDSLSGPQKMVGFVSTATFDDNGRTTTQSNTVRCEYSSMTGDGRAQIGYQPDIEGDRHWAKRADGSIIVFAELHPCIINAALNDRKDVEIGNDPSMNRSNETYVFDSSDMPTKVDVFTGNAFTQPNDLLLVLKSVSVVRTDAPTATPRLAEAFPGLAKIIPDNQHMGLGADIFPGSFIGVRAEASQLAVNTKCGTSATSGIVILPSSDGCVFINDCEKSSDKIVCGKPAGAFQVNYDATFSTAHIEPGKPDKNYKTTLFNAGLPAFRRAPGIPWNGLRKWMPQICMEKLCAKVTEPQASVVFYYPAKRLLIEARPTSQAFHNGVFDGLRTLE